jgi:hypothetical protein
MMKVNFIYDGDRDFKGTYSIRDGEFHVPRVGDFVGVTDQALDLVVKRVHWVYGGASRALEHVEVVLRDQTATDYDA